MHRPSILVAAPLLVLACAGPSRTEGLANPAREASPSLSPTAHAADPETDVASGPEGGQHAAGQADADEAFLAEPDGDLAEHEPAEWDEPAPEDDEAEVDWIDDYVGDDETVDPSAGRG